MLDILMANSAVCSGMRMSSCVSTHEPISRSNVKPTTPLPTVSTSMLCGPYTAYPAATCCDPACRKSFSSTSRPDAWCGACNTEKMVPMETLTSIFDEPSRGSNRSEEHTSEIQSLMRISYAVFCLKKKKKKHYTT